MAKRAKSEGFEDHLGVLERIVEELEGGELSLDESLQRYREGVKRLKSCYGILRSAEQQVRILVRNADGELSERTFEERESGE